MSATACKRTTSNVNRMRSTMSSAGPAKGCLNFARGPNGFRYWTTQSVRDRGCHVCPGRVLAEDLRRRAQGVAAPDQHHGVAR